MLKQVNDPFCQVKTKFQEQIMWEKPSYEIISAGAEVTAYIHKR
ncbi:MAG: pyrroloquinoline quinone precursor peptide PqqA [Leptolyngbya sp.]|nr:pyrroloquinoline quinone precursor peptide PqqA [Candidatus Melainabacteria bacterium]